MNRVTQKAINKGKKLIDEKGYWCNEIRELLSLYNLGARNRLNNILSAYNKGY